jgi:hypothetical protein
LRSRTADLCAHNPTRSAQARVKKSRSIQATLVLDRHGLHPRASAPISGVLITTSPPAEEYGYEPPPENPAPGRSPGRVNGAVDLGAQHQTSRGGPIDGATSGLTIPLPAME